MTTSSAGDEVPAFPTAARTSATQHRRRPRLIRHAHAEWIKLRSLRSSRWLLLTAALALPVIGAALTAAILTDDDGTTASQAYLDLAFIGTQLSSLLLGTLGATSIAGEFSTRTAVTTFTVAPARTSFLTAKAILLGTTTALAAGAGVTLTYLVTGLQLSSHDLASALTDPGVGRALLGCVFYLSGMTVLGVGLGALVRSTAAAIGALVVLLYAVPLALALLPASGLGNLLNRWWLTATVTNVTHLHRDDALLSPPAGAVAFIVWVLAFLVAGLMRLRSARI